MDFVTRGLRRLPGLQETRWAESKLQQPVQDPRGGRHTQNWFGDLYPRLLPMPTPSVDLKDYDSSS